MKQIPRVSFRAAGLTHARMILAAGGDPTLPDSAGRSVLYIALDSGEALWAPDTAAARHGPDAPGAGRENAGARAHRGGSCLGNGD